MIVKIEGVSIIYNNYDINDIIGNTKADAINNECSLNTVQTTLDGDTSFSNMLMRDIHWYQNKNDESDLNNASFSVSPTYLKYHEIAWQKKNLMINADAYCPTYYYYYNPQMQYKLNTLFKTDVEALSAAIIQEYYAFFDVWGTHVTVGLYCGSRYSRLHEFDQNGWNQMQWNKWDIPYLANAEYQLHINPNAPYNDTIKNEVVQFGKIAIATFQSVMGILPIGKLFNWLNASSFHPFPYNYTLIPIVDLITPNYFPNYPSDTIEKIQSKMKEAISSYCSHHPFGTGACKPHAPDFGVPPIISPNAGPIKGSGIENCDSGQTALSCAIATDTTSNPDKFWSVYPEHISCAGEDSSGANLYSICTSTSKTTTYIEMKSFDKSNDNGLMYVDCDQSGKPGKVTGCGMQPTNPGGGLWDSTKEIYGTAPNGCHCKHEYGGKCYAICSIGVESVRFGSSSNTGGHWTNLSCASGQRLFGCGIQLEGEATQPSLPSFYAADQHTCTGFSKQNYKLWNICGVFVT